jgi:hypothetical protein
MKPKGKARHSARATFRLGILLKQKTGVVEMKDGKVIIHDLNAFLKAMSGKKVVSIGSARRALNNYGINFILDKCSKEYYLWHEQGVTPETLASLIDKPDPRYEKVAGEAVDTYVILEQPTSRPEETSKRVSHALTALLSKISTTQVVKMEGLSL